MGALVKKTGNRSRLPWVAGLIVVALSVGAIALCRPPDKVFYVDLDTLQVARKLPGAKPVAAQVLEALRVAGFHWVAANDPPPPGTSVVYLSVVDAEGLEVDAPPVVMAAATLERGVVRPVSKEPGAAGQRFENVAAFRYILGFPLERAKGRYEMVYGYDCAIVCLATISLFMRRDARGWQVYDRRMNAIR